MNTLLHCTLLSMFSLIYAGYTPDGFNARTEDCYYNLCNTTEGYPTDKILKILERNKKILPLFENGFIVDVVAKERVPRSLHNDNSEITGCKTVNIMYFPHYGRSIEDLTKTIVNVKFLQQQTEMEICLNQGTSCSNSTETGKCLQRFENREFLTITEKDTMEMDTFSIPAGCICKK